MNNRTSMIIAAVAVGALCLSPAPSFAAGTTKSYSFSKRAYAGSRDRSYKVYQPEGLSGPAALVMVLHGCEQTHDDVLNEWGWKAAADRYGFILVAPFITSYDGLRNTNCWGFWFDQHNHEGMGEPEDLHQIGIEAESNYTIDPNRRYITGLSSGGGMAMVAAVTHNEYWAAAAPAAGLPHGEDAASVSFIGCPGNASFHGVGTVVSDMQRELDDNYKIPLLVLHNEKDCTVLITAGQNMRDAHLRVFGEASHDTASTAKASEAACTPFFQNNYGCKHVRYTQDGTTNSRSIVETVFYSGPQNTADPTDKDRGHYWIGGQQGMEGNYAVRAGPSYPDIAWDFFSRHARGVSAPIGVPQITLNGPNPLEINLNTTFADPGATATDREDGPLAVTADCSRVNTAAAGEYTCTYTAIDSDNHTAAVSRTVLVKDPNAPTAICNSVSSSPRAHIDAGRAVVGGPFSLRALSKTDRADIGASFDTWSTVVLYEGEPGDWYSQRPAVCNIAAVGAQLYCGADTIANHRRAGRTTEDLLKYYAKDSGEMLGWIPVNLTSSVTLKETSPGYFVKVSGCP
jgi:poly(hydroxyalkanoate) depolymerase family esterase